MGTNIHSSLDRLEQTLGLVGHDALNAALDVWDAALDRVKENAIRSVAPSGESRINRTEIRLNLDQAIDEEYGRRVPEYDTATEIDSGTGRLRKPGALSISQVREGYEFLLCLDELGESMSEMVDSVVAAIERIAGSTQAGVARVELEAAAERAADVALQRRRDWIVSE